eukprot:TRINITY_DN75092_c0_g1_i1.p2 TRINITY_DN75092_c0_g1~~TRINITY_DN75092_c0_g1_i1.p2  ORF type:complete len:100 (-),score=19.68 TRINITY_DN75092_c0_g1_i1:149-448(-)
MLAAKVAYCPNFGEVLAGCAVQTKTGEIISGSSIGTWSGHGRITPLTAALASLGARNMSIADAERAVWVAASQSLDVDEMRREDADMLQAVAPSLHFGS